MNVNIMMIRLYLAIWVVLVGMVIGLALYRLLLTNGHFTVLHVRRSELPLVPGEVSYAQRLDRIDWWGKILTVAALAYGLAMAVGFLYFL